MAPRHLALGLVIASLALAGCLAGPGGSSDTSEEPPPVERLGGWANPDVPVVGAATADLVGDDHVDVVVAQENGSITVLDLANRSTAWQDDVGYDVDAVDAVGGPRGPAVAVADAKWFDPSEPYYVSTRQGTEVRLFNVTSGEEIAERFVDDLLVRQMTADDLDGDGLDDLVLAGHPIDPHLRFPRPDRTEVAVLDGRFESGGSMFDEDDGPIRWRQTVDGDLVELASVAAGNVTVATDERVAAFDSVGHRLWELDLPDVADLDADAGGVLAVASETAVRAGWDLGVLWKTDLTGGAAGLLGGPDGPAVIADRSHADGSEGQVRVTAYAADGNRTRRGVLNATGPIADLARVDLVGHGTTAAVGIVGDNGTEIVFLGADLAPRDGVRAHVPGHPEDLLFGVDAVPHGRDEAVLIGTKARLHVFGQP